MPEKVLTRYHVVFDIYSSILYYMTYIVYYIHVVLVFAGIISLIYNTFSALASLDALVILVSRGAITEALRILISDWVYIFIAAFVFRAIAGLVAKVYNDYVRDRAEAVRSVIEHRVGASASLESITRMLAAGSEEKVLSLLRATNVYLVSQSTGSAEKESLRLHVDANTGARFVTLASVQGVPLALPAVPESSATQVFSLGEEERREEGKES